jgi:5-methylcytosine-specific restriction endonuclease McrA
MVRGLFRKQRNKDRVKPERGVYRPRFRRKGGVSRIVRDGYGNGSIQAYHVIVQEVLERDGRQCRHLSGSQVCGSIKNLQVHHIKPLSQGGKTEKTNMITLCEEHHESRHPHMAMKP